MSESFDSRDILGSPTTIESTTSTPTVTVDTITTETLFDGFTVLGGVDSSTGSSSIAMVVRDSTDAFTLSNNIIQAADAQDGEDGLDGTDGVDGGNGQDGAMSKLIQKSCSDSSQIEAGGSGGSNTCQDGNVQGGSEEIKMSSIQQPNKVVMMDLEMTLDLVGRGLRQSYYCEQLDVCMFGDCLLDSRF